jgi:probable F420-dependent oxidoreductase
MKFGVILPNFGQETSRKALLATAQAAEGLGFDSIWSTDHILLPKQDASRFGRIYEAITSLAFLAGTTSHIKLGVSSLVLPQRNPILVAKQIAALDALSAGRVMLCVGVGWSQGEFSNLGESFENRGRRTNEAIRLLRTLWQAEGNAPVSFQGRYYRFHEAVFSPAPAQPGGPPIWVGGHSQAALQRAAKLGDGWHPSSLSLESFRPLALRFQSLLAGREKPISLRMRLTFGPSKDPLQGSPDQVAKTLQAFQESGLDYAVITFPGESQTKREKAMRRFMETVAPQFGERT